MLQDYFPYFAPSQIVLLSPKNSIGLEVLASVQHQYLAQAAAVLYTGAVKMCGLPQS